MSIHRLWILLILLCSVLLVISGCDDLFNDSDDDDNDDVTENVVPETPSLITPENEAVVAEFSNLELTWSCFDPDGDPLTYDIYLSEEASPGLLAHVEGDTSYTVTSLTHNTEYYWKIIAADDHGHSVSSEVWSFTTGYDPTNHAPEIPTLVSPLNEQIGINSDAALLKWDCSDEDGDTLMYHIYLGTTETPVFYDLVKHLTQFTVYDLEYEQSYYWRIVANDNNGHSVTSQTYSFTTMPDPTVAGQMITAVTNYGIVGDPNFQDPSMQYPDDDGYYHLWEGRTWIAAVVDGEHRVSHADYGNHEFTPISNYGEAIEKQQIVLGNGTNGFTYRYSDEIPLEDHVPIGVEVYETSQILWADPNILHIHQVIRNVSGTILDSFYVSWVADFDISTVDSTELHMDDMCSFDSERQLAYMWDGDDSNEEGDDTGEYGRAPYYAGIALLEAPAPLAAFQWWNWDEDPSTDDLKFQFIAGTHPAAQGYPFRADPPIVFDYRVLLSVGPMTLDVEEEIEVDMIYVIGYGLEGLTYAVDNYDQ